MIIKYFWMTALLLFAGCGGGAMPQKAGDTADASAAPEQRQNVAKRVEDPTVVEAGDDQHVLVGKAVTLYASQLDKSKHLTKFVWREGDDILSGAQACELVDLGMGTHEIALEARAKDGTVYVDHVTVVIKGEDPGNALPEANDLHFVTPEDTPFAGALRGSDRDGDPLRYVLVSLPAHGKLSGSAAHLHYTPDPDFYGTDSFMFKTNDGKIDSDLATVSITVEPRNDAPVVEPMQLETMEEQAVRATLQASDKEGDNLSFIITQQPSHGSVVIDGVQIVYTPEEGFSGEDRFVYKASDGMEDSAEVAVKVTVAHVNHPPVVSDIAVQTNEDTTINIPLSATERDGDPVTFRLISLPQFGTAQIDGNILHYQPDADRFGIERLTYVANDTHVDSAAATVTITVAAQNDAPVVSDLTLVTDEDQSKTITLQGSDVENDPLSFTIVARPLHGTLMQNGDQVSYTPEPYYHGSDSFTYKANDTHTDSAIATVDITVNSVNNLPIVQDMTLSVTEGNSLTITLQGSDADGDPLTFYHDAPSHGVLSGNGAVLNYTPENGFTGTDSFIYWANDTHADSLKKRVTITVNNAPNTPPVASDMTQQLSEDGAADITLQASDAEQTTLTYTILQQAAHGTLTQNGAIIHYVPASDYYGTDTFTYRANDGIADSNIATVGIQIDPVNDAPVATPQNLSVDEDTNLPITLGGTDIDGDTLQDLTVVTQPSHGTLSCNGFMCTYAPFANFSGSDFFTYTVSDGSLVSEPATVSITVNAQNDAPVAVGQSHTLLEDTPVTISLNATDIENDLLTYSIVTSPQHGNVTLSGNSVTYTPDMNFNGTDSFSFKANDGTVDSNIADFNLTINPVNDAPVALSQSLSVDEDTNLSMLLSGSDIDGDTLTYAVTQNPANGTLSGIAPNLTYTPSLNFHGTDYFTYVVNDGTVNSAEANVTITVNSVNDAPVANAGTDIVAKSGDSVTLDGSNSTDPDGTIVAWEWKEGSTVLAANSSFMKSDFTVGTHTLTLTITDDSGAIATDTVTVTINPATALTFQKHLLLEKMNKPEALFFADLDGDGYRDILTADSGSGDNRWLLNERNRSFDTSKPFIRDNNPWTESIYAADIDGDGDIDVLPGSYGGGNIPTLAWYENDGKTNFSEHEIAVTVADAAYVSAGDMDRDGDSDIIVGSWSDNNQNGSMSWYENDGNQNFTEHIVTSGRTHMRTIIPADLDKDGDIDLIAAEYGDGKVAWFDNNGSQSFTEHILDADTPNLYSVVVADLDGDGYLDIASSPDGNGNLYWFRNNHDGTFAAHQLLVGTDANEYGDIKTADFDNDGDTDLLYSAYGQGEVGLFRNDGSGNFTKELIATGLRQPSTMAVGDLDFDGDLDFGIALFSDKAFAWYENRLLDGPGYRRVAKTGDPADGGFGAVANYTRDADQIVTDHTNLLMWADDSSAVADVDYWSIAQYSCSNMTLGGYDDWRIPNLYELYYLLDRSLLAPQINSAFQNIATDDGYWIDVVSSDITDLEFGWIDFNNSYSSLTSLGLSHTKHIRCVRGEPISFHLIRDDAREVVLDYQHDLMWDDSTAATASAVTLSEAQDSCANLSTGGFSDWRLPNINELYAAGTISGVDLSFNKAFVNNSAVTYWSGTYDGNGDLYVLDFGGTSDDGVLATDQTAQVRCVRNIR